MTVSTTRLGRRLLEYPNIRKCAEATSAVDSRNTPSTFLLSGIDECRVGAASFHPDDVLTLPRGEGAVGGANGRSGTAFGAAKRTAIATFERAYFASLAKRCNGNVSEMARQSGMERHHVRAYLRKYGIDKSAF